jgi:hypothetical protein
VSKIVKYAFLFSFIFSISLSALPNYWLGFGVLTQNKASNLRDNPISKIITLGLGYSYGSKNLNYFEIGYGLSNSGSSDESNDRTSFVKAGYERFFNLLSFTLYTGISGGSIIRTIEAKKRSSNWQLEDLDYDVEGISKQSAVSYMGEINFGTRFLNKIFPGFSLDWNIFSLIYNNNKLRYFTGITLVHIGGAN